MRKRHAQTPLALHRDQKIRCKPRGRGGFPLYSKRTATVLAICLAVVLLGGFASFASADPHTTQPVAAAGQATPQPSTAPLNPGYTVWLKRPKTQSLSSARPKYPLGQIPDPYLLPQGPSTKASQKATTLPAAFVLGPPILSYLALPTPVEDQNPYGACWCFASLVSLESGSLYQANPYFTADQPYEGPYSENNMALCSGFDPSYDWSNDPNDTNSAYNAGGTLFMATAYLAREAGPQRESIDTYGSGTTKTNLVGPKWVGNVDWFPRRTGPTDNATLKQAIMTYGALYTSMDAEPLANGDPNYWNASQSAYYDDAASGALNHAVEIVGWIDNYPASNFPHQPPGNGAWIVRNNWGTNWGGLTLSQNGVSDWYPGYFMVSYYDKYFGYGDSAAFDDSENGRFWMSSVSDPLGQTNWWGYGSNTAWCAYCMATSHTAYIVTVGFYTPQPGTAYTLYVGPSLSVLGADGSGTFANAGYHTVNLSWSPPAFSTATPEVVAVKLTTPAMAAPNNWTWPIAVETNSADKETSHATAMPAGHCYVSPDGSSWTDFTTVTMGSGETPCATCINVFMNSAPKNVATLPANTSAPQVSGTPAMGNTLSCSAGSWSGSPAPAVTYQWLRNGSPISGATVANYTVQAADAGHSLSCQVAGTNIAGQASATSNSLQVPAAVPPANTRAPQVSGTPALGDMLSCTAGSWSGSPAPALTYQWLRDGAVIGGAVAANYTVQAADQGHSLSCKVKATNVAGQAFATSNSLQVPPAMTYATLSTTTKLSGPSSVKVKRSLKLSGTVSPSMAPGSVTIAKTRLVGKKWKGAGSVTLGVSSGRFAYSFKPKYKGKWRFVASYTGGCTTVGSTTYTCACSKSGTKTVKVK